MAGSDQIETICLVSHSVTLRRDISWLLPSCVLGVACFGGG